MAGLFLRQFIKQKAPPCGGAFKKFPIILFFREEYFLSYSSAFALFPVALYISPSIMYMFLNVLFSLPLNAGKPFPSSIEVTFSTCGIAWLYLATAFAFRSAFFF